MRSRRRNIMRGKWIRSGRRFVAAALVAAATLAAVPSHADEGMWLPQRLADCPVDAWHARGLALEARDIYSADSPSLTDAIVKLGGGTGSFVSHDGLIVTNHHVAYRAIQRSSRVGADHLADGFLAETAEDEIPAPGFEARVLLGVEDVTNKILGAVGSGMSGRERYDAIDKAEKKAVAKAEKGRDVYCEVRQFYGGRQYLLYTYFKIKDIRLVYTPPQSIGEYGGEIDNWMWPRHTGDFAFMRAYVAPDGHSADYDKGNVPYHPKRFLAVSRRPLTEGDFTMVIGYPGATRRYRSSYAIDFFVNAYYPRRIDYLGHALAIVEEESARGRDVELLLTGTKKSLANSYKNNEGMLEGLKRAGLLAEKRQEEEQLAKFIAADPKLQKKYGRVLADIGAQYDDYRTYWEQRALLGSFRYTSSTLGSALTIYKWAVEREKKDIDRDRGYQDRDRESLERRLSLSGRSYDERADKRLFAYFASELAKAGFPPSAGLPAASASADEVAAFVDDLYAGTRVTDDKARMEMFGMSKKELLALGDPMIELAAKIDAVDEKLDDRFEAYEGALQDLRPKLIEAYEKFHGAPGYPDANSTMRLSVGEVKGYSPSDAVHYGFQTTLSGVAEKNTGKTPFAAPEKLLALHADGDYGPYADPVAGDVPVCFLTTNDVTGGNSGSPILNGRGELIGLVFDGNWESISADYQFVPALTRTINVDSRYILFLLDKFSNARALLDELEVVDGGAHG